MIMRKTYKHARRSGPSPVVILLAVLLTVLCVNLAVVVALVRSTPEEPGEPMMEAVTTAPAAPVATEPRETEPVTTMAAEETQPSETAEAPKEREYLPALQEKREENEDTVGWLTIEGTKIDYPVMYTPQDPEKYLHLGFDQKYSFAGLPFIDANCSLDPESDNLITEDVRKNSARLSTNRSDPSARAEFAVDELRRARAFDRPHLVVAVPTGSGWVDAAAVRGFENRWGDDLAIVAQQYSDMPSWAAFVLDRGAAEEEGRRRGGIRFSGSALPCFRDFQVSSSWL